ncbi:MAG: sulfatase-like hydrolase/transferase, partial [Bacteroidota bacterium]
GYCTDVWFEEAKKFIAAGSEQPFFLYLSTNAPHGPVTVPREYVEPYLNQPGIPERMAWFYGMIASVDENVGKFQAFLREEQLLENTIFILMTDNGTRDGYSMASGAGFNAGMRGVKATPYEGGHRVPFSISWPAGGLTGGTEIRRLTAHLDVLPTLIDLVELELPTPVDFDGVSLVPLLGDTTSESWPERTLYVHNQVSFGQKLVNDLPVKYKKYAVMTDQYRLVNGELYDMYTDPGQEEDLSASRPQIVDTLLQEYDTWWEDISENFDRYNATIVGNEAQRALVLSSQFWHGDHVPYSHEHVRNAMRANGFWDLNVEQAGDYQISLRRWPRESGLALGEAFPRPHRDSTRFYPGDKYFQAPSRDLPVSEARLQVGDFDQTVAVDATQEEIQFQVTLPEGEVFLQTWLMTETQDTVGAYYVYLEPLAD